MSPLRIEPGSRSILKDANDVDAGNLRPGEEDRIRSGSGGRHARARRLRRHLAGILLLAAVAAVLWGYGVGPMWSTLRAGFRNSEGGLTAGAYARFFALWRSAEGRSILGSVGISIASVAGAGIVGLALAILLHRFTFPLRRFCGILVLLPIALPPLMGVEAFVLLFGLGGVVPRLLHDLIGLDAASVSVSGFGGVLIVHTFTMYPYFYMSAAAALGNLDVSLEEASRSLGASRILTWRRVLFPLLTPAIISGAVLTFMSAMSSYTAPLLFGWDSVMTRQIVLAKTNGDSQMAAVIATVLAGISILFLVILRRLEGRSLYRILSKGGARRPTPVQSRPVQAAVLAAVVLLTLILLSPILLIALLAFAREGSWRLGILPGAYTFDNFLALARDSGALKPVLTSLQMSGLAVLAAMILGVAAAYALGRYSFRGRGILEVGMMLSWALPGTVVAVNLISAFSHPSPFGFGRVLVGTYWIVPLAYFVRFSPLIFRSTSASLAQFDPSLEEAGRSLGANGLTTFRRVLWPLLLPGIMAGTLLAFVDGVGEFVASILLYTPRNVPLSIAINNELYGARIGIASVYGLIQVALVLAAIGLVPCLSRLASSAGTQVGPLTESVSARG